ncbi:hypothetical protein ACQPYA_03875 [Micromonospora sp. CA-263727]|uniref:hypothetical protein n=1 Tax=Micromonospora sp. CA-263727 TaxID=3239967 RepID=UPI003D8E6B31
MQNGVPLVTVGPARVRPRRYQPSADEVPQIELAVATAGNLPRRVAGQIIEHSTAGANVGQPEGRCPGAPP